MEDLRTLIAEYEKNLPDQFVRVSREVDPKYEISAVIKKLDLVGKHPLVYFENVKGYDIPVVCNTDTTWEKFGLALGCPPVAIRSGAVEDVIRDGVDGLLVEATAEALSQGLTTVLGDDTLRSRLAGQARLRAEEFSSAGMAGRLVRVYQQALSG